ncbi:thymidylate kinase-like isoform X1 [Nicotiana tabacum]|uniref:Thymidylate kinase n=2 Tax=Nicotiana TaxID=4085 RepID=A0A1S4CEE1_TOBAC|nr:PREDICTED: thymidylate kinase-like isoform X1 [Nicotiana sylvestris]XP_016499480.1 PREDICTED: thymidylate kinase-like isoform X1 [Nicotiana tabacum]XP_016499481.1 PREDICTED: thymidylate kinase-like isoform X1 [Nicotiana tabacum]
MTHACIFTITRTLNLKVEETLFSGRSFVPEVISTFPTKFGTWAAWFSLKSSLDLSLPFKPLRLIHMENKESSSSRGALIVLEGLDRCGKTSQSGRLYKYLDEQGHSVESWRFPDRNTGVGQMISSYLANESQLDDHAIHLLFSANRWEKRSLMEDKLRSGTTLIVDRYSYSGVAFSSAKGLDIGWCKAPEIGLLAPDLVAYLDISPEKAAERGGYGGERYEQLEFQEKVARSYSALCDPSWKVIDATLPVVDIEKKLREVVLDCMMACQKGKPLSQLWPSQVKPTECQHE